jgi:hypothetical protein
MTVFPLLFGHAEWPVDDPPRRVPPVFDRPAEPAPARVTLAVPAPLKARIEESAALEGVPPDAWIRRVLARSVDPRLTAH